MTSSPNNYDSFAQQLAALRQRLASTRDRLSAQLSLVPTAQSEIYEEFQMALNLLQTAQTVMSQARTSAEVEQLRASVRAKDVLLREIHHRVKNNLQVVSSLLDLEVMRSQDAAVQAILRSNQSRISLISLVHEYMSQSGTTSRIGLGEYVQSLTSILVRTYAIAPNQVTFRTDITGEIDLPSNQVVSVGLIVNELIANAVQHGLAGAAGEIVLALEVTGAQITLSVSDTGNGFPPNFDLLTVRSLGFRLINSLVQQIDGTLTLSDTPETTITIRFGATGLEES